MTLPASPPASPSPAKVAKSAPRTFIGGRNWKQIDVFWGEPGGKKGAGQGELLGYLAEFGAPGRPQDDEVQNRAAHLWGLRAVYCLNAGTDVVYVGEGILGDRLKAHAKEDLFAGKWDSFSWLAPAQYEFDSGNPPAKATESNPVTWAPTSKRLVEFLELVALQFGMPIRNKQEPELKDDVAWLEQYRSKKLGPSLDDMIRALYDKLAK